jgi:hypothetical protein
LILIYCALILGSFQNESVIWKIGKSIDNIDKVHKSTEDSVRLSLYLNKALLAFTTNVISSSSKVLVLFPA